MNLISLIFTGKKCDRILDLRKKKMEYAALFTALAQKGLSLQDYSLRFQPAYQMNVF